MGGCLVCRPIIKSKTDSCYKSHNTQMRSLHFLCFVDPAAMYNLFQMKRTRCTLILSIFISTSLHVSVNYVSIIRRYYCIHAKLVFISLYGWLSGLQTRQPPIENEKYHYRKDTVRSPDDGHIVDRNMYRSLNKYTKN